MNDKKIEKYSDKDHCPVRCILSRIGDKWSVLIISLLGETGPIRFNEIGKSLGDISQKMLTTTLRSLEADGLVSREIYPVIPPRVEYQLTDLGKSLLPHLQDLSGWANENMSRIVENRQTYETTSSR